MHDKMRALCAGTIGVCSVRVISWDRSVKDKPESSGQGKSGSKGSNFNP